METDWRDKVWDRPLHDYFLSLHRLKALHGYLGSGPPLRIAFGGKRH